jgi:zinc protease
MTALSRLHARFSATVLVLIGLAAAQPAAAVEVEKVVSPGGIEAWLVEDHSNPIVSLELAFRGGGALDPQGREGLAHLVSGLLDEGAGPFDSQTFQGRLEDLSITLRFEAGLDTFGGSLRTLTENLETAGELLRLALTEPRFDAEPVERIRSQILVRLRRDAVDPDRIASRQLRQLLYPEHPYGRPVHGTPESLGAIAVEDLRRFVAERLARDLLKVAVVGDITPDALASFLDRTFLGLPARAAPAQVPDTVAQATGRTVVIERDVPQSVVSLGQPGIDRHDPDFYTAFVVNHILGGGGFASRLYTEVREERGLAYSVYSYLSTRDHASVVVGGVATANERVAESLDVILGEWARMAEAGPSAEELASAKTFLTGSYPLRQTSTGRIAAMLLAIQLEDLGIDYINRRNDFIEAVNLEDARRVARRLYDPSALTVVVVGRPEGLESSPLAPGDG